MEKALQANGFEAFWNSYPLGTSNQNQSIKEAKRMWERYNPDAEVQSALMEQLAKDKANELWTRGMGIPYASTYLHRFFREYE